LSSRLWAISLSPGVAMAAPASPFSRGRPAAPHGSMEVESGRLGAVRQSIERGDRAALGYPLQPRIPVECPFMAEPDRALDSWRPALPSQGTPNHAAGLSGSAPSPMGECQPRGDLAGYMHRDVNLELTFQQLPLLHGPCDRGNPCRRLGAEGTHSNDRMDHGTGAIGAHRLTNG
jgi:hypothetical protein